LREQCALESEALKELHAAGMGIAEGDGVDAVGDGAAVRGNAADGTEHGGRGLRAIAEGFAEVQYVTGADTGEAGAGEDVGGGGDTGGFQGGLKTEGCTLERLLFVRKVRRRVVEVRFRASRFKKGSGCCGGPYEQPIATLILLGPQPTFRAV
jgi:hypothetical protein